MRCAERPMRGGFTAIELLIVLGIVMILAGMSVVGLTRATRAAALGSAAAAIQDMSDRARDLALQSAAAADGSRYGVVVAWDAERNRVIAGVIRGRPDDGKLSETERLLAPDEISSLPPSVLLWVGERVLGEAGAPSEIAWYFESGTGRPQLRAGTGFGPPGATVGLGPPPLTTGGLPLFGYDPSRPPPMLAPSTPETPGLSLRSRDQRLRRSIGVTTGGTFVLGGI